MCYFALSMLFFHEPQQFKVSKIQRNLEIQRFINNIHILNYYEMNIISHSNLDYKLYVTH